MSGDWFQVPPASWDDIRAKAELLRERLGLAEQPYFPVIDVIEKVLQKYFDEFHLVIGTAEEMKGAEGYTAPDGSFIMLRNDVYIAACEGNGRARFTAAHELGHLFLHTGVPLARVSDRGSVKPYMLSEPQANQFAAELLMPAKFITADDTPATLCRRFGVSGEAAVNRLDFLRKRGLIT